MTVLFPAPWLLWLSCSTVKSKIKKVSHELRDSYLHTHQFYASLHLGMWLSFLSKDGLFPIATMLQCLQSASSQLSIARGKRAFILHLSSGQSCPFPDNLLKVVKKKKNKQKNLIKCVKYLKMTNLIIEKKS